MLDPILRFQSKTILDQLANRRVVVLSGARQTGKTTLAKSLASTGTLFRNLDDRTLLQAAINDPKGFVAHGNQLMIIDEVQRAPQLLRAIKQDVDENTTPGRFLLTGSANIQSLPSVNESLAGRISKARLRPLSLGEIYSSTPHFIEKAFEQDFSEGSNKEVEWNRARYLSEALKGGFPEARSLSELHQQISWHADYVDALIERDLKDVTNIRRKSAMLKLIEIIAARSKYIDISAICKKLSISRPTVENYLSALQALYLVDALAPWHKTDYDRVGKREKLFLCDTGMMTSMLHWNFERVQFDADKSGKILETFIYHQLATLTDLHPSSYQLYHYRDGEQREIDFIVEREDDSLLCIEVKASSVVDLSMFKHITWFSKNIVPKRKCVGIILYTGPHAVRFAPNLWAVPMRLLWQ